MCGAVLILANPTTVRLVRYRTVLLIEIGLISTAKLALILGHITASVLQLRLIVFLVEFGFAEVSRARVVVEVIRAVIIVQIAAVDVIPVDVIDVGIIDVVAVVVVVAIDEGVGIGDVDVAVVDDG